MKVAVIRILRWWPYKLAFVVLFVLPSVPAIAIFAAERCLGDGQVCLAAHSLSKFGVAVVRAGAWRGMIIAFAVGWLVVCYIALSLGWRSRITSRLLLAFGVTLTFVFFPYVIPSHALGI